jgi:two-component system NtrC family response regulator
MSDARILIVEDDENLRQVLQIQLKREEYQVTTAANAEQAIDLLQKFPQDLILTDLSLPGISGIELLKRVRTDYPDVLVILMTAFGTIQSSVEAMKSGAYDYITKPVHPYELRALLSRAFERNRLIEEVHVLRTCLDKKYGFENIIGSSGSLKYALELASRVAATDATVLIQGETGTGKELIAKGIHFLSLRRERPFIIVNCAAIPRELLESELFGYVKGAFTGAFTHKKGKTEMAEGGTLLLDEIGEMPLELQVRVLRLIQEREIEKIGARSLVHVDVRIIAATHRDLPAMVKQNMFREDLYYRLLVVPIKLPPLRDRGQDIPELVLFFFDRAKVKYGRGDLKFRSDLLPYFSDYEWPGNVRQLENAVERLVLLSAGPETTREDLPDFLQRRGPASEVAPSEVAPVLLPAEGLSLDAVEKQLILQALERAGGNQTKAARFLGMSRRTLSYRLEKFGVRAKAPKFFKQVTS